MCIRDSSVHGVTAQRFEAREEGNGALELQREEEDLEVEQRLLVGLEMRFAWNDSNRIQQ